MSRALPVSGAVSSTAAVDQLVELGEGVGDAGLDRGGPRSGGPSGSPPRHRAGAGGGVTRASINGWNCMPRSISGRQNQPRSGRMTRRSWASASMAPMPNAWPLSAAAVGTGNVSSRVSSRSVARP